MIFPKSRKGIFLPMFVIIFIFLLSSLAFVMKITENQKNDFVGLRAINIIKSYSESQKVQLYIDLSSTYSKNESLQTLAKNGGFSENNRCEKSEDLITKESYVIWNTCPVINPNMEFLNQFKKNIKSYIDIYESPYKKSEQTKIRLADTPEEIQDDYNYWYTKTIRNTNVIDIKNFNDKYIITFSEISLPIENNQSSTYSFTINYSITKPDLLIYKKIHSLITEKCIKKDFKSCENSIKQSFTKPEIIQEKNLIKIKIPEDNYSIYIGFYSDKPIPIYEQSNA